MTKFHCLSACVMERPIHIYIRRATCEAIAIIFQEQAHAKPLSIHNNDFSSKLLLLTYNVILSIALKKKVKTIGLYKILYKHTQKEEQTLYFVLHTLSNCKKICYRKKLEKVVRVLHIQ